jgi:hypothetical protein
MRVQSVGENSMWNKKLMVLNIISSIFWVFMCFPVFYLFAFSAMLFDAPGSESSPFTLMLFYSIISFFPAVFFSIPGSWVFYILKKSKLTIVFALLPFLSIISGLAAFVLISTVCSGSLVCP